MTDPASTAKTLTAQIKAACHEKPTALNGYGVKLWSKIEDDIAAALSSTPQGGAEPVARHPDANIHGIGPHVGAGRNPCYEGCFEDETPEEAQARRLAAHPVRESPAVAAPPEPALARFEQFIEEVHAAEGDYGIGLAITAAETWIAEQRALASQGAPAP